MLHQLRQSQSRLADRRAAAREQHGKVAEAGFTLIELLIVIVILGILAAVVVFSVQGIQNRGNTAACQAQASTITTAGQAYYAKNNAYAADVKSLYTAGLLASDPTGTSAMSNVTYDATTGTATCSLS